MVRINRLEAINISKVFLDNLKIEVDSNPVEVKYINSSQHTMPSKSSSWMVRYKVIDKSYFPDNIVIFVDIESGSAEIAGSL